MKLQKKTAGGKTIILIVEDSPTQAERLEHLLQEGGYAVDLAVNGQEALRKALKRKPALIISDVVMPGMDGYTLCGKIKAEAKLRDCPVVLVTSLSSPEDVLKGLQCGADNFLTKPYNDEYLLSRIEYILSNRRLREDAKIGLELEVALGGRRHRITAERQQILDLLISTYEEAVHVNQALKKKQDELLQLTSQLEKTVEVRTAALVAEIAERKRAAEVIAGLAAIVETSDDAIIGETLDGIITTWNLGAESLYGYAPTEVIGRPTTALVPADRHDEIMSILERLRRGEHVRNFETVRLRKDGGRIEVSITTSPILKADGTIVGASSIERDITERRKLEAQLRQAQKMEAIGSLTGGIAHDFNNILGVILVQSEFILDGLASDGPLRKRVEAIGKAALRAAALTKQLLAFSRQQVLDPRVIALNDIVADTEEMLERVIGEDIEFVTKLEANLGLVEADPSQIQQVVMNLTINARDAMPRGGTLLIETANVDFEEEYVSSHAFVKAGRHVMLAVSDTGHGMDELTRSRIFEPFFTTKELGKGTGLGLATVYGIVKQSGGHILVYSEVDHGTTFKVYFPRIENVEVKPQHKDRSKLVRPRGSETILVVEDDEGNRDLLAEILEGHGYKVVLASNGAAALALFREYKEPIDLLITDVIMPGIGGAELTREVQLLFPSTKIMYMSGYTNDALGRQGIAAQATGFLQKPFSSNDLTRKVRDVLDLE